MQKSTTMESIKETVEKIRRMSLKKSEKEAERRDSFCKDGGGGTTESGGWGALKDRRKSLKLITGPWSLVSVGARPEQQGKRSPAV
jgi:hypothetical protein